MESSNESVELRRFVPEATVCPMAIACHKPGLTSTATMTAGIMSSLVIFPTDVQVPDPPHLIVILRSRSYAAALG